MRALLFVLLFLPSFCFLSTGVIFPAGYFLINEQKCLKMYWEQVSQPAAESQCKNDGGTLVIIKNAIDNQAVYKFANQAGVNSIWIGLSCFDNTTKSSCYWDDASGTAALYNNFPTGTVSPGVCTSMFTSPLTTSAANWISNNCNYAHSQLSYLLPYVCEVPGTDIPCAAMSCACAVKNAYNGNCYIKSTEPGLGLKVGDGNDVNRCRGYGNLTSIHSKMEVDYIRRLYRGTNTTHIYIGAKSQITDRFEWFDGSKWDFNYMDPLNFKKGNCLVMDVQGLGLWSQVDCDQKLEYLCKFSLTVQSNAALPEPVLPITDNDENASEILLDASNCNSTLYLAPGSISSFGYPDYTSPPTYCTWQLRALGPYRLGIYFDFWATYGSLNIFDESGQNIGQFVGTYDRTPFAKYLRFNVAKITFEPRPKTGTEVDRGFHAVVLPL